MTLQSQNSRILKALKAGDKITPMAALRRFGSFRLASRVSELKEAGYAVKSKLVTRGGRTFSEYSL